MLWILRQGGRNHTKPAKVYRLVDVSPAYGEP